MSRIPREVVVCVGVVRVVIEGTFVGLDCFSIAPASSEDASQAAVLVGKPE